MRLSSEAAENLRGLVQAWFQTSVQPGSLAEAEAASVEIGRICSQVALEESLSQMGEKSTYRGTGLACSCGARMRFVGYRRRWIKALCGEASIKRAYYHCSGCGRGEAPWDREQGLNTLVWTPRVKALVARACARLSYREAVALLGEAGVIRLEASSAEQIVSEVGGRLRDAEEAEEERLKAACEEALRSQLMEDVEPPAPIQMQDVRPVSGERLYVSLDAAKAHIDGEWHDIKVGAVYTARPDASGLDRMHERGYVASQRAAESFGWQLRTEAFRWRQTEYKQTVVIADGADYNWRIASDQFPKSTQVLDFYHASEHVWTLARQLYRQDDERDRARGERWARERITSLASDGPVPLLRALKRRRSRSQLVLQMLRREQGYFQRNKHRMAYPNFRKAGMMIGSGPVEAGCKVVVAQRMKQSGMRWSTQGADPVLAIRATLLSDRPGRIDSMAFAA